MENNDAERDASILNRRTPGEIFNAIFAPTEGYPIKRDDFFKMMLPKLKGRVRGRSDTAKDFIRKHCGRSNLKVLTTDEVNETFKNWPEIQTPHQFKLMAGLFGPWYQETHRQHVSEQRREAAKKRKARPPWKKLKITPLT